MLDRLVFRRILGAVAANGFARAMRIAEQLLLIPLLLAAWGVERYGEWIALTSIALFATFVNFGIGQAAQSDIVLRHSGGDARGAARSHVTALILLTLVIAAGFACVVAASRLLDVGNFVALRIMTAEEGRSVVILVSLAALVTFYTDPLSGAISAAVGAATPNLIFGIAKAAEVTVIAAVLRWSAGPVHVAAIMLIAAVLNVLMHAIVALYCAPWLSFRPLDFDISVLRRTWRASLGFFLIFAGVNVVNIQVPRLIVFHYFGAATLVAFTVLVTYTKTARNLVAMMSQAAQVEIGRAFARADFDQAISLVHGILGAAVAAGLLLLAGEMIFAPLIVPLWTHGEVAVAWDVLASLSVVALAGTYFDAALLAAGALNKVLLVGLGYWVGLAVGTALALILLPWIGLVAMTGIGLLLPDLIGAFAATRTLDKILGCKMRLVDVLSPGRIARLGSQINPKI